MRQRQAALAKNDETRRTFVVKKLQAIAIFAGATVVLFVIGGNAIWFGFFTFMGTVIGVFLPMKLVPVPEVPQARPPVPGHEARWATADELLARGIALPKGTRRGPRDIGLGWDEGSGLYLRYQGQKSVISVGPTRSGKLATVIGPNLLTLKSDSIVVNDPKGEIAAITAPFRATVGKVFVLNPFNVLGDNPDYPWMKTARFNPLEGLVPSSGHFSDEVTSIAGALILSESSTESHWPESARNLVAGLIGFVCAASPGQLAGFLPAAAEGSAPARTLSLVNRLLNLPAERFGALMQMMAGDEFPDVVYQAATPFLGERTRETESILNTARTQLGTFLRSEPIKAVLEGSDFTWEQLQSEPCTVFIVLPEDRAKAYARFTRLIYASSLRRLMREPRPEALPVYYVMDELTTSLGDKPLDVVEVAFNMGATYGIRIHAFVQNWAQLKFTFKDEGAQSLASACGLLQFFRVGPMDKVTYDVLKERGGTTTVWRKKETQGASGGRGLSKQADGSWRESINQGWSRNLDDVPDHPPLIDPECAFEELGSLDNPEKPGWAKQILIFDGLVSPVMSLRSAYWTSEAMAARAKPNPFRKG